MQDLPVVPVLTNWKKSEEDICFYEKREKWKQLSACVLQ